MVYETAETILISITIISMIVSQVCYWINYFQEKTGMISHDTISPLFVISGISMVVFIITALLHDQIMSISEKIITGITSFIPARPLFYCIYIAIIFGIAILSIVGLLRLSEKYSRLKNIGCLMWIVFYAIILIGITNADEVEKYFVPEKPFDVKVALSGGSNSYIMTPYGTDNTPGE